MYDLNSYFGDILDMMGTGGLGTRLPPPINTPPLLAVTKRSKPGGFDFAKVAEDLKPVSRVRSL